MLAGEFAPDVGWHASQRAKLDTLISYSYGWRGFHSVF